MIAKKYSLPNSLTLKVEEWDEYCNYKSSNLNKEFLIIWIKEGRGFLFIAGEVVLFQSGELYMFGQNRHMSLKFSDFEKHPEKGDHPRAISLLFDQIKMEESLFKIPEAYRINKLFQLSNYGIRLPLQNEKELTQCIEKISNSKGLQKLLFLLEILDLASRSNYHMLLIGKSNAQATASPFDSRMNSVYNYIRNNYRGNITLRQVAEVANMSPTGFCRYFKLQGHKTFSQYLSEVRISRACDLLRNPELSIADCCYSSGYNYLSNFNTYFKKITGMTPSEYRTNLESI